MIAKAEPFVFLTSEGLVKIPYFQRMYVWGKSEWDKLFDDMSAAYSMGGPYLGTIIMQVYRNRKDRTRYALVVDGQQRLTTLSLLLKALYDSFDDVGKDNCIRKTRFFGCLFHTGGMESSATPRIEHSKADSKYYQAIVNLDFDPEEQLPGMMNSKIAECYHHFAQKIAPLDHSERVKLLDNLTGSDNEMLVVIRLDESDNEQRIFDTMNTAGTRLSGADTIKNYLYQRAIETDEFTKQQVEALYKVHWEDVFAGDDETVMFWNTKTRNLSTNLENLLRSIAEITEILTTKDNVSDLLKLHKNAIDAMDVKSVVEHIELIGDYGRLCKDNILLLIEDSTLLYSYHDYKNRLFSLLRWNNTSAFTPYIMSLLKEYANNEDALKGALKKLETMYIRRWVCGYGADKNRELCAKLIHNPEERDKTLEGATPSDAEFEAALMKVNTISHANLPKTLLFWLELYRRETNDQYKQYKGIPLSNIYSMEHIMPKSWVRNWYNVPVKKPQGCTTHHDDYRNEQVNRLGNLTLLPFKQNSDIQAFDFRAKVEGGRGKTQAGSVYFFGGMKDKKQEPLGITTIDIVNPYLRHGKTTWDESRIRARTKDMVADFMNIWPWQFEIEEPVEDVAAVETDEMADTTPDVVVAEDMHTGPALQEAIAEPDIYPEDIHDLQLLDGEPDSNYMYDEYVYFKGQGPNEDSAPEGEQESYASDVPDEAYYTELYKQTYDELAQDTGESYSEPIITTAPTPEDAPAPEASGLATLVLSDDPFAHIYDVVAQAEKGFQDAYAELEKTQEERAAAVAKSRDEMKSFRDAKIKEMHNDEDDLL